jgi:MFS superfamily sulfate permease-like transporter
MSFATVSASASELARSARDCWAEAKHECIPSRGALTVWPFMRQIFHLPFLPLFYRPGWLTKYIVGPQDATFYKNLSNDFVSGLTVAITLIPQALSNAALAGLPPITGLYSVLLPIPVYIMLGTSMHLSVGPVALISLMMGELLGRYGMDSVANPEQAINFSAQACFCSGLLMVVMGVGYTGSLNRSIGPMHSPHNLLSCTTPYHPYQLFNLGNLIRFISHPVMSGFTTAAAMIIGLNQIRSAFGFPNIVPRVGV